MILRIFIHCFHWFPHSYTLHKYTHAQVFSHSLAQWTSHTHTYTITAEEEEEQNTLYSSFNKFRRIEWLNFSFYFIRHTFSWSLSVDFSTLLEKRCEFINAILPTSHYLTYTKFVFFVLCVNQVQREKKCQSVSQIFFIFESSNKWVCLNANIDFFKKWNFFLQQKSS